MVNVRIPIPRLSLLFALAAASLALGGSALPLRAAETPGEIQGRVLDAAGNPLPGAEVVVHVYVVGAEDLKPTVDAAGRFRFPRPVGAAAVCALAPGHALDAAMTNTGTESVTLRLGAPREVTGKVLGPDGKPAEGVAVRVMEVARQGEIAGEPLLRGEPRGETAPLPRSIQERLLTRTGAEGRYRFTVRDLTAGYHARMDGRDYRTLSGGDPLGDQGMERRFSDLTVLSFTAAVSGRVVDAQGAPVAGATVFWPSGTPRHHTTTDEAGRFRLEGLPERPVALVARAPDRGAAFVRAAPGTEVTLVLTTGAGSGG